MMREPTSKDKRSKSAGRDHRSPEDEAIARIDAERFWGDWMRDLTSAVKARDTKRQRKLKIEAIEMKDSIEFLEAKAQHNVKRFFEILEARAARYIPPPRPDGEVATLTLTINRPQEVDEPQFQIEQDAG